MASFTNFFAVPNTRELAPPVNTSYATVTQTATATTTSTVVETLQDAANMTSTRATAAAASKSAITKAISDVPLALIQNASEAYTAANKPAWGVSTGKSIPLAVSLCVAAFIGDFAIGTAFAHNLTPPGLTRAHRNASSLA
jgi:Tfp pilus assembly protein FimV